MKRLIVLLLLFLTGILFAWEPFMVLTLQTNIDDQVNCLMPDRSLHFSAVSKVEKEQPFHVEIAFIVKEKSDREQNFTGSISVTSPDGSTQKIFEKPAGRVPAGAQGVFVSNVKLGISFEQSDQPGKYRFELSVKDASGKIKKIAREVELVNSVVDNTPMDRKSFNDFLHFYYRDPAPGRFFAAWDFYLKTAVVEQQKKEGGNFNPSAALLGFCEILKLNPQFHDEFAALCSKSSAENQAYYAFICAGLGKDFLKKYGKKLHSDVQTLVERLGDQDPFVIDEVTAPYHHDMLWSKFMITGRFEPVKMLSRELRQRPFMDLEEAKKKQAAGKKLTADEGRRLMNRLMQISAFWSLGSNIKQGHALAGYYLETILRKKMFADDQEAQLVAFILKNVNSKKGSNK